ncbi:hypothetical protein AgCh_016727 [Apium graveolens]
MTRIRYKMFSTLHNAQDVIVELLCTAMVWAYFKSLTNRTPETLAVANEGLRQLHYSLVTSAATLRYLEMSKGRALLILSLLFLLAAFNVVEALMATNKHALATIAGRLKKAVLNALNLFFIHLSIFFEKVYQTKRIHDFSYGRMDHLGHSPVTFYLARSINGFSALILCQLSGGLKGASKLRAELKKMIAPEQKME